MGLQNVKVQAQRTEDRWQSTEDRWQRTEEPTGQDATYCSKLTPIEASYKKPVKTKSCKNAIVMDFIRDDVSQASLHITGASL